MKHTRSRRLLRLLAGAALLAAAAGSAPSCDQGGGSCDAVCDNYFDKCSELSPRDTDRNACLEICYENFSGVPGACDDPLANYLACLAGAESLSCDSPWS